MLKILAALILIVGSAQAAKQMAANARADYAKMGGPQWALLEVLEAAGWDVAGALDTENAKENLTRRELWQHVLEYKSRVVRKPTVLA